MHLRPLLFFVTGFVLIVVAVLYFKPDSTDFASARENIVMRNIGHEILLSSGDSSSRVLPIDKQKSNQYHISFESTLQFTPDSVVQIIRQAIETNNLPSDYVVNVIECQKKQVIFGYAIVQTEQTNLVPCLGRKQPKGCYSIQITFRDTSLGARKKDYYIGAGCGLAAVMLILSGLRINHKQNKMASTKVKTEVITSEVFPIGNYKFHRDNQFLEYDKEQIELSDKESKLLYILAKRINELVERGELQKVWEDDGVIVGRSLDMFISRLRKKLEKDPKVRLVNVHGRGYKLEITGR